MWGIQPSEFWDMDVEQWWWLYEAKTPAKNTHGYAGKLTDDDVAELYEMISG